MNKLFYLVIIMVFFIPQPSHAQVRSKALNPDSAYEKIVMPQMFSNSVLIDDDEVHPIAPNIAEVSFMKIPVINGIDERVDRLIQGVKKDLPPEYDHYGHEIRRYMSYAGDIRIFEEEDFLVQQIRNVRKAGVIAEFWKKHLEKEIKEIVPIIEGETDKTVSFSARTAFRQNKVTTRTFLISLKSWVDANERYLLTVLNTPEEAYDVLYPEIIINNQQDRLDFYNVLNTRQIKLKEIRAYSPFVMMVY